MIRRLKNNRTIPCTRGRYGNPDCLNMADICEQVDWNTGNTQGTSFFYFCDDCHYEQKKHALNGSIEQEKQD